MLGILGESDRIFLLIPVSFFLHTQYVKISSEKSGKGKFYLARSAIKEKKGTSLIIIDYLQLIKGESGAPNRRIERVEMAGDLKCLAEKLDIPVMLIFQLAEVDLEERNHREPTLIDLADAGSLDQDADLVLLISRDEITHPFARHCNRGRAEIIIAKNRRGSKGMAALKFSHQYGLFENFACGTGDV